jgi:hypothetical protein
MEGISIGHCPPKHFQKEWFIKINGATSIWIKELG